MGIKKIFLLLLIFLLVLMGINLILKSLLGTSFLEITKNKIYTYTCVPEGERGNGFSNQKCCSGLKELSASSFKAEKGSCMTISNGQSICESSCSTLANGGFICGNCGDNICGIGENQCNCSTDCK